LGPNPFRLTDAQLIEKMREQTRVSRTNMAEFDRMPVDVRLVEHAVGNLQIARRLASRGIHSAEQAEPVVRRMLEERWGRGESAS
jgi:hypothetical protein